MAASAAAMRRSPATVPRLQVTSAGNAVRAPAPAAPFTSRRRPSSKSAAAVAVAAAGGDSSRGFGGASAAPAASKRAAPSKSGSNGDETAAKQLAETRAALREALDELAAMSAKAEVRKANEFCFCLFFLTHIPRRRVHKQRLLRTRSRSRAIKLYCSNTCLTFSSIEWPRLNVKNGFY